MPDFFGYHAYSDALKVHSSQAMLPKGKLREHSIVNYRH